MSDTEARRFSNRRVMDIEDVLIWTYRDELPKRRHEAGHGGEACSMSPMFRTLLAGGRVDTSSRGSGGAAAGPHLDALIVEKAVVELALRRSDTHPGVDPDYLAPDFAALGIDQAAALAKAQRTVDLLVVVNAGLRRRPPYDGAPEPAATLLANGKPAILAPTSMSETTIDKRVITRELLAPTSPIRAGIYRPGAHCPVAWSPDPQTILVERAEYAVWRAALVLLAAQLEGRLSSISVLTPGAAERPWLGDDDLGKPIALREDLRASVRRPKAAASHRPPAPPRRRTLTDRGRHLPREQWPEALAAARQRTPA